MGKTEEKINCRCNFDNINSFIKKIINIGIFKIDENSNNKIIETEINLKLDNEEIYGLKLSIFGTTVNNYKIEKFYKTISFDYLYQKEKKINYWVFIIILIIIICGIVIYICKRKKKNVEIVFVGEMESNNSQINNFIHNPQNDISQEFNSENNYHALHGNINIEDNTPQYTTSGNINS